MRRTKPVAAPMVARVYLRVSTDAQDLERQEAITTAAKAAGYYVAGIYREKASGARLAVPGVVDLSDLAAEAQGVAKIVLEAVQIMLFRLALQMARDDYEDRRERQRQGIELARQAGRYKGRRADPKRRAQVVALRKSGYSINKTAELAGYSAAQVKRIWAEVSQAEAKQHGAFVEDALTEADALAAVGQDERQEERA
ncbi:recombinase family protein [Escherichia coli]